MVTVCAVCAVCAFMYVHAYVHSCMCMHMTKLYVHSTHNVKLKPEKKF